MNNLIEIKEKKNIPEVYQNTPIGELLEYHNLGKEFISYEKAKMLIGMCMDNRKRLIIPDNFAFIIRTGGANLSFNEFKISFAISIGNVKHIAIIGHTDCGMVKLSNKRDKFIEGIINNLGWTKAEAEKEFEDNYKIYGIENEIEFTLKQVKKYREKYKTITIAPMIYKVENNKLYLIEE